MKIQYQNHWRVTGKGGERKGDNTQPDLCQNRILAAFIIVLEMRRH